ncbi:MAG: thioredoxin family protein [Desulfovibrionales bacterium]|nr:thioredoxin family protein [Desulfovibrionales bacterium]
MKKTTIHFALFLAVLLCCAFATPQANAEQPVTFSAKSYIAQSQNNDIVIALTITPDAAYHFYSREKGDTGQPTSIGLVPAAPDSTVRYPAGVQSADPILKNKTTYLYNGKQTFFITVPAGTKDNLALRLSLLLCSSSRCVPVHETYAVSWNSSALQPAESQVWWTTYLRLAPVAPDAVKQAGNTETRQSQALANKLGVELPTRSGNSGTLPHSIGDSGKTARFPSRLQQQQPVAMEYSFTPHYYLQALEVSTLWKAILFGLLAGFILNFMPCVLPVISLKLSSLVSATQITDETQRKQMFREHNIFFALGILTWFVLLTIILTTFELAWGQLFQNEGVVIGLTLIIFVLALSIFDIFPLPMFSFSGRGTENGNDKWGAYSTGLLATLLATPCSGPFLGGVLGWAFLQPLYVLILIFLSVGAGMALPYIVMAFIPELVTRFPKPGAWTQTLAQIVGLFLMGTVVYLLYILPTDVLPKMLVLLWITGTGAWIWGRFSGMQFSKKRNVLIRLVSVLLIALSAFWLFQPQPETKDWEDFTPTTFSQQLGQQRLVVDFSADWCPNCKVLEQTVFTPENRAKWEQEFNVIFIKVDMTKDDPEKQRFLEALGSNSIPVVAIFTTGSQSTEPIVLRDLFTSGQFTDAMRKAFKK